MARKKEQAKPLFDLKHDFVDSLENVCQQSIMLLQAVDTVLRNGNLPIGVKEILAERSNAMRSALMKEE